MERESRRNLKDILADCHSATQFSHYATAALDDLTKASYKRFIGDIGPEEIIDMITLLAQLKGRYLAQALADMSSRRLPSVEETNQLRTLRGQIEEVKLALNAAQEAIEQEQIAVRGISAPATADKQPILRQRPEG